MSAEHMPPKYECTSKPIYKRFWWPHPYARERGLLWRKVTDDFRHFVNGREFDLKRQRFVDGGPL